MANGQFDHGRFQGEVMTKLDNIEFLIKGQEKRIRMLEQYRWWLTGAMGIGLTLPWVVKAMVL